MFNHEIMTSLMEVIGKLHQSQVHDRRSRVLAEALTDLLPEHGRVLDLGCGDGLISAKIQQIRSGLEIEGIDIQVRPNAHISVKTFDGLRLPHGDASFDAVMFVDVLHHASDPLALILEAARVSKDAIVIKDHTCEGLLAGPTLRFMDEVGNAHHGVAIRGNYWREATWHVVIDQAGLAVDSWNPHVPMYPWWASWLFGRSLHFVARLRKRIGEVSPAA